jgi:hypothetical protein
MTGEIIDVQALQDSLDYSLPSNDTTRLAFSVMRQIQAWIDDSDSPEPPPVAGVTVARHYLDISIGEFVVWSSLESDGDALSAESCIESFREQVQSLHFLAAHKTTDECRYGRDE